ncbi:MAG: DNA methyltransferase [Bradymonadales bacterium]|jgi:hypothetical protein
MQRHSVIYEKAMILARNCVLGGADPVTEASLRELVESIDIDDFELPSFAQELMGAEERREDGVHFTCEENILNVLNPLFLDDLARKFALACTDANKLRDFHHSLASLKFLDPACGCGNFLLIAYRELRCLENRVIEERLKIDASYKKRCEILVGLDQCYGIEIMAASCELARVALMLMEQITARETRRIAEKFACHWQESAQKSAKIVKANALVLAWQELLDDGERFDYIFGNPPFIGARLMTKGQKQDLKRVLCGQKNTGNLDYVGAWFYLAAKYMQLNNRCQSAFVATNSICQGEQVANLWEPILSLGIDIKFAQRDFKWFNDGGEQAAVHCVIVGFGAKSVARDKFMIAGRTRKSATHINPYLVEGPNIVVRSRQNAICKVAAMNFGSMPNDGGHLIINEYEYEEFVLKEPQSLKYIRPLMGSSQLIHHKKRWCLWLVGVKQSTLRDNPLILERVERVREHRLRSVRKNTQKLAQTPTLFGEIRHPSSDYLVLPAISSENRQYIPMDFVDKNTISTNTTLQIAGASIYDFGILTSVVHMAWMRAICGRLEISYNYSIQIVYNNFVWPQADIHEKLTITALAQTVLDTRLQFPDMSLAKLYSPRTMPESLREAHRHLDRAVLELYGLKSDAKEHEIVEKLMNLYAKHCDN